MTLTRYLNTPLLSSFAWPEFDRAFRDDFFRLSERLRQNEGPRFVSSDENDAVVIRAELPGVSKEDIDATFHGGTLVVRGERTSRLPEGYRVHRNERISMRFSQAFTIGKGLDEANIEAKIEDGILTIRIPKRPEVQPRPIEVKVS